MTARQFQGDVSGMFSDPIGKAAALVKLAADQFGPLVALVPIGFLAVAFRQPRYALLSGTAAVVTVVFAGSYINASIERYYLGPAFFAWTWLAVLAARRGEGDPVARGRGRRLVGRPAVGRHARALADRASRWPWRPRSPPRCSCQRPRPSTPAGTRATARTETWAADWLDQAFASIAPDAVVVSWWTYSTPMWYGQRVQGRRPDITIIDDSNLVWDNLGTAYDVIDANLGKRPVYVIRATVSDVQALADRYVIEPVGQLGNLYLVMGRLETTP